MINTKFSFDSFSDSRGDNRKSLVSELEAVLQENVRQALKLLFASEIEKLMLHGHQLREELPWTVGEFAFVDESGGSAGLRVAFDVVVSVGFADRILNLGDELDDDE
jgi:hypothetical protein